MADNRGLLVVDDEEVVCLACKRIFNQQGFHVEVNTDARQGLSWATEREYQIILLDIKMPNMDGIQFLENLREKKPDVPVLIVTGYPSIPNAAAAMRLGACDYVTKPFTPEEITSAVQRVLATRTMPADDDTAAESSSDAAEQAATAEPLFWNDSWLHMEPDGSASVGAVLAGLRATPPSDIVLPRIGEVVYQGLPLAGVTVPNKPMRVILSPISGVVMAVNDHLHRRPDLLSTDPCGDGWIACVCTTQFESEAEHCHPRQVLLINGESGSSHEQSRQLTALGCQVRSVSNRDELFAELQDSKLQVAIFDAASLGAAGPDWVGWTNAHAPAMRIIVVGSPQDGWEGAYRKHKILYYAVEPFADNEIADILAAAFRPPDAASGGSSKGESEPLSGISITNRNGHKVQLLAAPGLLWRNEGLGSLIGHELLAKMLPVVMVPGVANLSPANILKTAAANDRLMILLAKEIGALPGALARDTKPDFGVELGNAACQITTLTVQHDSMGGLACLDQRTTAALASHIVREMAVY